MLPTITFDIMSLEEVASLLSWSIFQTEGPLPLSEKSYQCYPELIGKLGNSYQKDTFEIICSSIKEHYDENIKELNKISEQYQIIWSQYQDAFMRSLSEYFDLVWPEDCMKISAKIGNIPVFPRYIKERRFDIGVINRTDFIDTCMHECCHFLFFEKWKQLCLNWKWEDFDSPSLLWYLSEIAIDPILNDQKFSNIFSHQFHCYDSFYQVKIGDINLVEKIRTIFKTNNIEDAMKLGYEFLKENEVMIREQCHDDYLRKDGNYYICNQNHESYQKEVETILQSRKPEILSFFEVEDHPTFTFNVYLYDTKEELVQGLQKRGFKKDPDYMCACQKDIDHSLNFFVPKDQPQEDEWSKEEYKNVIFHEEIHGIQNHIYGKQPEWVTEGVAKYLDGTYQKGIKYLLEHYIDMEHLPSMLELETEFGMYEYDSYDYAYIMVKYLIETYGKHEFLNIIGDADKLNNISKNLVEKAVMYYYHLYQEELNLKKTYH